MNIIENIKKNIIMSLLKNKTTNIYRLIFFHLIIGLRTMKKVDKLMIYNTTIILPIQNTY